MRRTLLVAWAAAMLGTGTPMAQAAGEPKPGQAVLTPATFEHYQKAIRTEYEFRWRCLPWEISRWDAAQKAAKAGKPILVFGGHDGVTLGFE